MSGFATPAFLAFARSTDPVEGDGCADLGPAGAMPYVLRHRVTPLTPTGGCFVTTPICLSGPPELEPATLPTRLEASLRAPVDGGFVQSRDDRPVEEPWVEGPDFVAHCDVRTNHRLSLDGDENDIVARMRSDARSRLRKVLRREDEFELTAVLDDDVSGVDTFVELHDETARRAGFEDAYRFRTDAWRGLLAHPRWQLLLLRHRGAAVGGAVVTEVPGGFDYTFAVGRRSELDVGRALVWFVRRHLAGRGDHLDLGGGISEGDALADFKRAMGAEPVPFRRLRFVARRRCVGLDRSEIRAVLEGRWPPAR